MKTPGSIQRNRKRITDDGFALSIKLNEEIIKQIDRISENKCYSSPKEYSWSERVNRTSILRHAINIGIKKILEEIGKKDTED